MRAEAEEPAGPEPEDIAFCFDLALVTRDALEGYGRLLGEYEARGTSGDLRAAALTVAQRIAAYERLGFVKLTQLANLSDELAPFPALGVLRQLAAALVMLAQEEPDPATLLSEEEVRAAVAERELTPWLESMFEKIPDDWEAG